VAVGNIKLEEGCGALNIVDVSELLEVTRLIMEVNNTVADWIKFAPCVSLTVSCKEYYWINHACSIYFGLQ
jgi:hypothetical protein